MSRRPLCHLLYTNAPGRDGVGFRTLAVNFPGSPGEQKEIEGWLTELHLAEGEQQGWAVHGFAVDRHPCFALAVVDRPSFARDDHGREGGFLAHALLVLLEEGRPAGDFGLALFDKARTLLESHAPKLELYLEGVRLATDLEVPELQLNNFLGLAPRFLEAFYAAAFSGGNGEVFLPGYSSDDDFPEHLLAASLALPPRLRLNLSWRVGLRPGRDGFVARVAQDKSPSPPSSNVGTAYLDKVQELLKTGWANQVERFASRDWGVRQWSGLQQALLGAEGAPARKERPSSGKPAPAPRAKSPESYDAEYQALEKDLRDYLDQRLAQAEARETPGRPPSEEREEPPSFLRRLLALRPEIYFLILLLLVLWAGPCQ